MKAKAKGELHVNLNTCPSSLDTVPKYWLLTIAPHTAMLLECDLDFNIIPMSKGCRFQVGIVICGLDTWDLEDCEATPQIISGTFNFQNIPSASAYSSLANVLPCVCVDTTARVVGHDGQGTLVL